MIDAKAVVADLNSFGSASAGNRAASGTGAWLQGALQGVAVRFETDPDGNQRITLPGLSTRNVVMGASLRQDDGLGARLGVITGVETLKALAKRFGEQLPCGVQLVLWANPGQQSRPAEPAAATSPDALEPAAYLSLQVDPGTGLQDAGKTLGMAAVQETGDGVRFSPRLTAIGAEAIQEMTGTVGTLALAAPGETAAMARRGVPSAVMYVRALGGGAGGGLSDAARLDVLQAAEAFGRWVEATVHLVAGEAADLWALEHRVPHSQAAGDSEAPRGSVPR